MQSFRRYTWIKIYFKMFLLVMGLWICLCNMVFSHGKLYEAILFKLRRKHIFGNIGGLLVLYLEILTSKQGISLSCHSVDATLHYLHSQ